MEPVYRGIINSAIWIICGALVVLVRALTLQGTSILYWELLGFGMIAYGGTKLVWVLAKGPPTNPLVP